MVELHAGEVAAVPRDVGDDATGRFGPGEHQPGSAISPPRASLLSSADCLRRRVSRRRPSRIEPIAAGSEKAAARHLGLSHSTVKHHLATARSKLGATTTAQLVWILSPHLPEPDDMAQSAK